MSRNRPMTLGLFLNHTGHHVASWRHPRAQIDANVNIEHYLDVARMAEAATFDFMFFADTMGTRNADPEALSRSAQYTAYFEPLTLLSALSVATANIGLISTATTSFYEPYHIARLFASLDHLSHGRAGWNIVTSSMDAEAQNFGQAQLDAKVNRYSRAREFVDVCKGLWDSWDEDAFIRDRDLGRYFDPAKVHLLNHAGEHFKVRGPLNVPRPPQGYPVLVQAGSSDDGRDFAASIAEIAFMSELVFERALAFTQDVKARMAKFGRNPAHLHVLPGVNVTIGRTDEEAQEKLDYMNSLIHPVVGREILSTILGGTDLKPYDLDQPLPHDLPDHEGLHMGTAQSVLALARRENLTIRQLYMRVAGSRGKLMLTGSPKTVVDEMERWFEAGAVDGFIIQSSYLPGELEDFIALCVPELKRRGLMRQAYAGGTLRENLGLPHPPSRYAPASAMPA